VTVQLSPDWRDFLVALIDKKVRFLVVGGHAVAVHAEPRFTKDLDVWVEPTLANARRLHDALVEFGLGSFTPPAAELAKRGPFWVFGRPPGQIDILTDVPGATFRTAWPRRLEIRLDPVRRIPVLGRADLLASKRAAGRPKDSADIAAIEQFIADERRRPARTPRKRPKP
jgi:hypothetical protein